jgi:hypothetical protein
MQRKGVISDDELTTTPRQGDKTTARKDQAGQASTDDGSRNLRRRRVQIEVLSLIMVPPTFRAINVLV